MINSIGKNIRIIVTGGRRFSDWNFLSKTLDRIHLDHVIAEVLHGDCDGADRLAKFWANQHSIKHSPYPVSDADWQRLGKKAGPLRNKAMIMTEPDLVVAFPGGRGTADCVRQAEKAGIPVFKASANYFLLKDATPAEIAEEKDKVDGAIEAGCFAPLPDDL